MKDKRRVPGAVLALAGSLAVTAAVLTGCGSPNEQGNETSAWEDIREHRVELSDGRTVTCIAWKQGYAGGLQCDWAGVDHD